MSSSVQRIMRQAVGATLMSVWASSAHADDISQHLANDNPLNASGGTFSELDAITAKLKRLHDEAQHSNDILTIGERLVEYNNCLAGYPADCSISDAVRSIQTIVFRSHIDSLGNPSDEQVAEILDGIWGPKTATAALEFLQKASMSEFLTTIVNDSTYAPLREKFEQAEGFSLVQAQAIMLRGSIDAFPDIVTPIDCARGIDPENESGLSPQHLKIESAALTIGCYLVEKDAGNLSDAEWEKAAKDFQQFIILHATQETKYGYDPAIPIDGIFSPQTADAFIELSESTRYFDPFFEEFYDPETPEFRYMTRLAEELRALSPASYERIIEVMQSYPGDDFPDYHEEPSFEIEPLGLCQFGFVNSGPCAMEASLQEPLRPTSVQVTFSPLKLG